MYILYCLIVLFLTVTQKRKCVDMRASVLVTKVIHGNYDFGMEVW